MSRAMRFLISVWVLAAGGCLPADPPEFRRDAGARAAEKPQRASQAKEPKRPRTIASTEARAVSSELTSEFSDDFERTELGSDWNATSPVWSIRDGRLCGERARNHPVWLRRRLPKNARIEFTATSDSPDGDIKVEAWGDGKGAAKGTSYDDATSYIAVFGGWKNSLHVLARLDEHGSDRQEVRLTQASEDLRTAKVEPGRRYRFALERSDGRTLRFSVDDQLIHEFTDPAPLYGPGHDHFGFNDWNVPVCFDDFVVTPLEG